MMQADSTPATDEQPLPQLALAKVEEEESEACESGPTEESGPTGLDAGGLEAGKASETPAEGDSELEPAGDAELGDSETGDSETGDSETGEAATNEPPKSLLEELDARQDEVLAQLDDLNIRIETLIADWTRQRQAADQQADADALAETAAESGDNTEHDKTGTAAKAKQDAAKAA